VEPARQRRDRGRLASPANGDVADADHGPAQPAPHVRTPCIALAPPSRGRRKQGAQEIHAFAPPLKTREIVAVS
jgi:hypothetical protein